jgi:large subunit ribosomal protein L24
VLARKQRVLIEGVRMIKKHMRKTQDQPQGSIAEREGPIHISNVRVVERGERKAKEKGGKAKAADTPKAEKKKAPAKPTAPKGDA